MSSFANVKYIRYDNDAEYTSAEFENKMKHQFSSPYPPHQKGTAGRGWQTHFYATIEMCFAPS